MLRLFKCLFGDITCSREQLHRFTVLQDNDYGEMGKKYCELVKGIDGKYFLKPILGLDCNIADNIELPSTEGWPASATTEDEFWELLNSYSGGVLIRDSSKVSNLLNDIALNIPNSKVYVDAEKGLKLCVPDQVILDILRTDEICINDEVVYSSKTVESDHILSDEMRAKLLFEKCMANLENNFNLTSNALKLLTQASMSHLGILINWRFINIELLLGIRCLWQASKIELKENIVSIIYNTTWEIIALDGREIDPHFMKACVKISILKSDLEMSSAGNAKMIETCSPFYKSLDDLLNEGVLPSEVSSMDLYLKKIEEYADYYYPIDLNPRDLDIQQKTKCSLIQFSGKSMFALLSICALDIKLQNYILSIANVGLPKYINSEAKRIFENKKLGCSLLFQDKEFDFSIDPKDNGLKILAKTFWKINPLGKIISIAVELEGYLLESCSEKHELDKDEVERRAIIKAVNKKLTGKSLQIKSNADEFIVERATQYFYMLKEDESRSWIKV